MRETDETDNGERKGRRGRLIAVAALALAAAVAGALAAPWLLSPVKLRETVMSQIQSATGLYVAARGQAALSLLPRPRVVIDGVGFADRNGALLVEAESLQASARILPLLAGRIDIASVTLRRPRVRLDLDHKPVDAPGALGRAAATGTATPAGEQAERLRLGVLSIAEGSARILRGGQTYTVDGIDASLEWPRIGEAATLTGDFNWRGERLRGLVWAARPAALLRGEQSVVTARLDGEGLKAEAQGVAQAGANARFSGRLAGSAPSLRQALRLLDLAPPLPGPFEDAQFQARASIGPRDAQLKDIRFVVDGNAFTGAATLRGDEERPHLTAALRSDFLALKAMLADAPPLVGADGQWSKEEFDVPDLYGIDVDLQIDAAHARLGRLTIDDAALAVTLRDGAVEFVLAQAHAYRGALKGRASFAPAPSGLEAHVTAQTSGVDAGGLIWDAFGKNALAGALDATIALDAEGDTMVTLMRNLSGRASLALSDGQIAGIDLERALRRLEKRPLASALDIRSGRSTLEKASATIKIENGLGAISDGAGRGPGFTLGFSGVVRFFDRALALKAVASEAEPAGKAREQGQKISFDVGGGWDDLSMTPDAQAFIRRSGAAAPLLPRVDPPVETNAGPQ